MNADRGNTMMWFSGACLTVLLLVVASVILLLLRAGMAPFWPSAIVQIDVRHGVATTSVIGSIIDEDANAVIMRISDDAVSGARYQRILQADIVARSEPEQAIVRLSRDGQVSYAGNDIASESQAVSDVTVQRPNAMGFGEKCVQMLSGFSAFVSSDPAAGGVLPALIGTITLVLLMSVLVMPIGIAAAIWLSEYSGNRRRARWVRAALTSLAGVPTIVYGVLGLGLFVHTIGGGIDRLFHSDHLPAPTFGAGGLLWAALTLAILTLPVVVVSIEQGLARIPRSLRDASSALGATRSETLWNLLLPMARPAVLTALILAIARAAGAVAPLMLVGAVKLASSPPIDVEFPYLHPSRQFMHLGYSVYDQAFASADTHAGIARAWTCALLLVVVVGVLNGAAILLRRRLNAYQLAFEQDRSA